jgi:CheY-like chemotaxis protein
MVPHCGRADGWSHGEWHRHRSENCQEHPCNVILLTASNETASRLWINATAPAGVLVKPILPQHLIEALQSLPDL